MLLFFSDKSAARNSSVVSLPSFSFVFLFHASISSSSCSRLLFFLLALIYSFPLEMGFINHCNAALGKVVLSAGRNTSPLTAPAGRKTLGVLLGSGDGLLMIFAFYVAQMPSGQGRRERSTRHLCNISSLLRQSKTNCRCLLSRKQSEKRKQDANAGQE